MATYMQLIQTQTLSAGAATIVFNSIPQTYHTLVIEASVRGSYTGGAADAYMYFQDGSGTTNYSWTKNSANGSGLENYRGTNVGTMSVLTVGGSTYTSNTFSNIKIMIPNYASTTQYKQIISESTMDNNATDSRISLCSGLWRNNTAGISSIGFSVSTGWAQNSTISLYGIKYA